MSGAAGTPWGATPAGGRGAISSTNKMTNDNDNTDNPPCPGTSLHDLGNSRTADRVRGRSYFRGNKKKISYTTAA